VDSSDTLFRRIAGVSALVAVLVGGLSGVLFLAAGEFRLDSLLDPVRLLGVGSLGAQLLRWGALTDMLGYYLLLVPLVVCVGSELRPRGDPIVDLYTVAGVLCAAIGATAAVVLAEAGPVLLHAYDQADPAARGGVALAFQVLTNAVYKGAWQTLEVLPLAAWAAGTGVLLWMLGGIGITIGILGLVSAAVRMAQVGVGMGPAVVYAGLAATLFDTLTVELVAVVDQTMEPAMASLWLRPSAGASLDQHQPGSGRPGRRSEHHLEPPQGRS
jgi:hypothetical protein